MVSPAYSIHRYDLRAYDFVGRVVDVFSGTALPLLHTAHTADPAKTHDQNTTAHALFYHRFHLVKPLYDVFMRERIMPLFKEDLCVQAIPTFRLSMPGGMAVKEFHRDSDYHHQLSTVNFWLPLTDAFTTNALWLESAPDVGDFHPVTMGPGQYLQFDAISLRHGNVRNDTDVSRVSFDFRVIPFSRYQDTGLKTVVSAVKIKLGSYYTLLEYRG